MAENSLREQILVSVKSQLEKVKNAKTIIRTFPQLSDLDEFGMSQFPVIALVGGLPDPQETKWSGRSHHTVDKFHSLLAVSVWVYDHTGEEADTRLSELADDVWAQLWANPTLSSLGLRMELAFDPEVGHFPPYVAFKLTANFTYEHTTGGI